MMNGLSLASLYALCASASEGAGASSSAADGPAGGVLVVEYLFYLLVIAGGIFFLALFKKKTSRGLTYETVRKKCEKLKNLLEETLVPQGKKKRKSAGNPARMAILRSAAEEAMWSASRLVDERKDLLFDGIADSLDKIADLLASEENAFAGEEEAEKVVKEALDATEAVLRKIEATIPAEKAENK